MNEISAKFKRQIEILGIAIKNSESLGTDELAQMYGVERLTIKRDLQELRSHGIDVHSEGKSGVRVSGKIDASRVQRLLSSYLALSGMGNSVDKASVLLTKKMGMESLNIAVTLQRCIENSERAEISYASERRQGSVDFILEPLQIFQADALWRVLAVHQGMIKQLLMTKILRVIPTEETFTRPAEERIEEVFRHSFLTWTGGKKYTVQLRLSHAVARHLTSRQLVSFQTVAEREDGIVEVCGTVNSLDELASWVVGKGDGIYVLSPIALKEKAIRLANGFLNTNGPPHMLRKPHETDLR
jgi:predicted DNA-binding transcriptional regulator YafY